MIQCVLNVLNLGFSLSGLSLALPRLGIFCASLAFLCLILTWKIFATKEQLQKNQPFRRTFPGNNNANTIAGVELTVLRLARYGHWEQLQDTRSGVVFFHSTETGATQDHIPPEIDQNNAAYPAQLQSVILFANLSKP
jgi:hypothetical protein